MTTISLKQIAQEVSYLQYLLGAVRVQQSAGFGPLQAAKLIKQLLGVQLALRTEPAQDDESVALEIETLLEQAYEMLGTMEITA